MQEKPNPDPELHRIVEEIAESLLNQPPHLRSRLELTFVKAIVKLILKPIVKPIAAKPDSVCRVWVSNRIFFKPDRQARSIGFLLLNQRLKLAAKAPLDRGDRSSATVRTAVQHSSGSHSDGVAQGSGRFGESLAAIPQRSDKTCRYTSHPAAIAPCTD